MTQLLTGLATALEGEVDLITKGNLILQALTVVQAIAPEIQNIITELQSQDTILQKIQTIIADVEATPAAIVTEIQTLFGHGPATTTTTTTPATAG